MIEDPITEILRKDPRYPRAAYEFTREALHDTVEVLGEQRHITARELMDGIRRYGRDQFGPLALTVFASWDVHETKDFGHIVFNLVEAGEMGKTDDDDIADFDGLFRLEDAFPTETGEAVVRPPEEDE